MSSASRTVAGDAIVEEIVIGASPERVWRALTDSTELVSWWSEEEGQRDVTWSLEPRLGGRWRSTGFDESCGHWDMVGEILEWEPPKRLVYTWEQTGTQGHGSGGRTVVTWELTAIAQGTRLRLTHGGFGAHTEARESYRKGWPPLLVILRRFAER
ncbi:MAG TPA: SRPBCC domain-containing protein [Gemmatimonadales bacterium]|jgi:uncharacterized protein YndB with AHSA1/START domain